MLKKMLFAMFFAGAMTMFADEAAAPAEAKNQQPETKAEKVEQPKEKREKRPRMGQRPDMTATLKESLAQILAKYDKDKDGKLSAEERAAAEADLDMAKLQEQMRLARTWRMFSMLDADKDGVLSEEEMAKLKAGPRRPPRGEGREGRAPREGREK